MATYETHRVLEADKPRIRCSGHRWHSDCDKPADICEHMHWNAGNTTGVSFFYYCDAGYQALVAQRPLA